MGWTGKPMLTKLILNAFRLGICFWLWPMPHHSLWSYTWPLHSLMPLFKASESVWVCDSWAASDQGTFLGGYWSTIRFGVLESNVSGVEAGREWWEMTQHMFFLIRLPPSHVLKQTRCKKFNSGRVSVNFQAVRPSVNFPLLFLHKGHADTLLFNSVYQLNYWATTQPESSVQVAEGGGGDVGIRD